MATRIPTAVARKDMAAILKRSARGERIKVTRHDKTIAVVIPKHDLDVLEDCEGSRRATLPANAKKSSGSH